MKEPAIKWQEKSFDQKIADTLANSTNLSPFVAKLLAERNIESIADAEAFISPKLAHLNDPFDIKNMDRAVGRIKDAIKKKEEILLVGDYDVDGISSVSILQKVLSELGGVSSLIIPRRKDEGYGLTMNVLKRGLEKRDLSLVIALDCGTNSMEEAVFLKDSGIDLIVVDHHQAKEDISDFPIILNPHLFDSPNAPWVNLCTAGLAFKLAHAIVKSIRIEGSKIAERIDLKEYLPLSALGTIADLVPLQEENRIISKFGLKHLGYNPSIGLNALLQESRIDRNLYPQSEDITFKLAPMINACGRMDDPTVATSLFLESDAKRCKELAKKMNEYNEERKFIEAQLTEEAKLQARDLFSEEVALVAHGDGKYWNPGVVGIVAGKLANSLRKPCLVLAKSENGEYRGSGRGVKGLDLVQALAECKNLLLHWGGHPVAVGLSIVKENLEEFTKAFLTAVKSQIGTHTTNQYLEIDAFVQQNQLNDNLLHEIEKLAPFGQGNPQPLLGIEKVRLNGRPKPVGSGEHFQFSIHNGEEAITGIAWRMADNIPPIDKEIDIAFRLQWNLWNQRKRLQMVMDSWKIHES
ncbi:MAG: single-stranded-DNA-specific exonuclease RecJ [Opitutales bacterium]|nr:single-stranded-DNA-specific exonuclease RecJ [Opitutales bacterium]